MGQQAATAADYAEQPSPVGLALAMMQADRDKLTHLLRTLAAELDGLDRQLSELAWPSRGSREPNRVDEPALRSHRDQLNGRLRQLARELNQLDQTVAAVKGYGDACAVGTCPHCGYPSLGSGLCAYCRPFLVG